MNVSFLLSFLAVVDVVKRIEAIYTRRKLPKKIPQIRKQVLLFLARAFNHVMSNLNFYFSMHRRQYL